MGLCKDCKYWGVDFKGHCDRVGMVDIDIDDSSFDLHLDADDDQGLSGELLTGPNFGCVHCEAK